MDCPAWLKRTGFAGVFAFSGSALSIASVASDQRDNAAAAAISQQLAALPSGFRPGFTFRGGVLVVTGRFKNSVQHHDTLLRLRDVGEVRAIVDLTCEATPDSASVNRPRPDDRSTLQRTQAALQGAMQWDPRINSQRVQASLQGDVAVLTGTVDSEWSRTAVLRAVSAVTGAADIDDRLVLQRTTGVRGRDLVRRSRQALRQAGSLGKHILIVATGPDLHLYGEVASSCESALAEDVVATVEGVASVFNHLTVGGLAAPASLSAGSLVDAMAWNSIVDPRGIRVSVHADHVALDGYVTTSEERVAAEQVARDAGAQTVLNRLRIAAPRPGVAYRQPWPLIGHGEPKGRVPSRPSSRKNGVLAPNLGKPSIVVQ